MKKSCAFIFFINLLVLSYSQPYMKLDYITYYDKSVVDSIIEKQNCQAYIVYQTMLQNDSLVYGEDEDKIATVLFWLNEDTTYVKLITKNLIYNTEKVIGNKVFNYKYVDKTGVDLKECTLKFAPPGLSPVNSEIIIYNDGSKKFFFEFGNASLYVENKGKYKYRKEFIEIIRSEIKPELGKFKPDSTYLRKPLFDNPS